MQVQPQASQPCHLTARIFDFIDIHPSRIQSLSYSPSSHRLYVSRQHYTEVLRVTLGQSAKDASIEQVLVLEPSDYVFEIDGLIVLVLSMEIKVCYGGRWTIYPYTTQLLPLGVHFDAEKGKLFTFHVSQSRQWLISEDQGVKIRYLKPSETPYHVTSQGTVEGFGKKIKPNNFKDNKFTIAKANNNGFLFVGSDSGHLHIYETKYLTHVKTFHRHQGSILSIFATGNTCYFTGSDSKIGSIRFVGEKGDGQWVLSRQVRGQSHDIMSIDMVQDCENKFLISGGITTDVCFYKVNKEEGLEDEWQHKVSYPSDKLSQVIDNYVIANNYNNFQIWKLGSAEPTSKDGVELLVKYELPFYKSIKQILVKKESKSVVLFVSTQEEASLWDFNEDEGLVKRLTVKNNYNLSMWYKKDSILTIRDGDKLEIFNYKNGNIMELAHTEVEFPTNISLNEGLKETKLLIGSKLTCQAEVYKIGAKNCKLLHKIGLAQSYDILDFCYYKTENLMVKYANDQSVQEMDPEGVLICEIVKLPVKRVRDYGWVFLASERKSKVFWYAVSEGKVVIVSKMKTEAKQRKIRVKQMPRIGNVISNFTKSKNQQSLAEDGLDWNLGIIPLNFSKMIAEEIQPIVTKKIL